MASTWLSPWPCLRRGSCSDSSEPCCSERDRDVRTQAEAKPVTIEAKWLQEPESCQAFVASDGRREGGNNPGKPMAARPQRLPAKKMPTLPPESRRGQPSFAAFQDKGAKGTRSPCKQTTCSTKRALLSPTTQYIFHQHIIPDCWKTAPRFLHTSVLLGVRLRSQAYENKPEIRPPWKRPHQRTPW